ncbi:hypothetical protein LRY65_01210 [Candidatus Woesebacteria bacterium]|nr:hypothetical protein [Candidatus Woesebacteria bacterium]MCD8507194.1 hypothetical protein [Candidatus Woesebacteria bacterium]MCD8526811.1 hypothetical protein [Candidatus Woesebacteria bacterium]MCD8545968.1 hypothetical protein [Candidatus Woesebacteria bacterium]
MANKSFESKLQIGDVYQNMVRISVSGQMRSQRRNIESDSPLSVQANQRWILSGWVYEQDNQVQAATGQEEDDLPSIEINAPLVNRLAWVILSLNTIVFEDEIEAKSSEKTIIRVKPTTLQTGFTRIED